MTLLAELKRKAIHLLAGLAIPVGYELLPEFWGRWILILATVGVTGVDFLRLRHPFFKRLFMEYFAPLIRRHERSALTGASYLLISSLVCALVFDKPVAVAAISFLVVGDTMAAVVGRTWGRVKLFDKTLKGSLACFVSCALCVLLVPHLPLWVGLAGAGVATVVELLPIPVDDNLRIAILSGWVMQVFLPK
jgi:dolichol kinase